MKTISKTVFYVSFLLLNLFLWSCSTSDSDEITPTITSEEANNLIESEDITDDILTVVDDFFFLENNLSSRTENISSSYMLSCLTKTIVLNGTTKEVTLDFGEGCTLPNENILSGKLIIIYEVDKNEQTYTVSYTFDNFYFNNIKIEGENSLIRTKENENGNPQSIHNFNTKLTWSDGVYISRSGIKTREWIEGFSTITWGDNVLLISGSWTTTFKNGTVFSSEILTPLRREMACRFLVSGIIEIHKNEHSGVLNFGDGACDNLAIFTNENGENTEIILKKRIN